MPHASSDLERRQLCKLLQSVRNDDRDDIRRLIEGGVPDLLNLTDPQALGGGETALGLAAAANRDDMLDFLLNIGAHPDVMDGHNRTPVMRAAELGHVQSVEKLVKNKPAPNLTLTDVEGKGVLFYCIAPTQRHARCAELIIANGADVNNVSKAGQPVLVAACETANENEQLCLMMLEKSADPNSKNQKTERTALMAAAGCGSAPVVQALLLRGAEVDDLMLRSRTHAAHEAAKKGHLDVLRILSAYSANFDQTDETGNTPIHYAAAGGHGLCIRFLTQRGCNPKPKNRDGNTARLIARNAGHKEAITETRRAERVFGRSAKNIEPWAIALYDFSCVYQGELLESFLKLDESQSGKISPEDFVETLHNAGAKAKVPEESDFQRIVSQHVKEKLVDYREFLSGRKYVNKQYLKTAYEGKKKKKKGGKGGRGRAGKTKIVMPVCIRDEGPRAEDGGPPVVFVPKLLHLTDLTRFSRDSRPRHAIEDDSSWYLGPAERPRQHISELIKERDRNTLRAALNLKRGPSTSPSPPPSPGNERIDIVDRFYKTPLMVACSRGDMELVKMLVTGGANVNTRDNFRWTPLHFACHSGLLDVVEYLLDNGANLEATAMNGATPLMRAIESSKAAVVQLLLNRGAKLRVENRIGQTPMDIAIAFANYETFMIIKNKWDSLPPVKDNKKGAKKKPTAQRPKSTTSPNKPAARQKLEPNSQQTNEGNTKPRQRKNSLLRSASALAGGLDETENITYHPVTRWKDYATSDILIQDYVERRRRYGWQADFSDFKLPFLQNVADKLAQQQATGDD